MTFKASLDTLAKIVTICVTILFAGIVYAMFRQVNEIGYFTPIVISSIFIGIYLITVFYRPLFYSIEKNKIFINRLIGRKVIDVNDIAAIQTVEKKNIMWAIRLWAVGGVFGYFGVFTNGHFGKMTWYATNLSSAVLIETKKGKRILLTPENRESFLTEIKKKVE